MDRKRVKMNKWKKEPGRCIWKMRLQRGRNLKSGETLVEVMVSIVIFLLLLALLQGSVAFCTSAQRKSREIRENTATAIENYWTAKDGNSENITNSTSQTLSFQTKEGASAFRVDVKLNESSVTYEDDDGKNPTTTFYTFGK